MGRRVLIYFPARLVPGLINFLAIALYTRLLSAEAYGRYALVLAVVGLVQVTIFYWLRLGLFRFFQNAQREQRLELLLSTTTIEFGLICLVVVLGWSTVLYLVPLDATFKRAFWFGLPFLLIDSLFAQVLEINQAALFALRYALLSFGRAILNVILSLILIDVWQPNEQALLLGLIIGTTVIILTDVPRWIRYLDHRWFEKATAVNLLRYGGPLAITFALGFVISTSDRLLLQFLLGAEEAVGVYAAGYDLANQTITLLFVVVNLAAYPLVVRTLEESGHAAAHAQLRQYAVLLLALTLPASVGLALIAQPLAHVMLGQAFARVAGQLLPWIVLAAFLGGVKAFYFDLAYQLGLRTELHIVAVAAAAVVNIMLNLWWIPRYGIMGAAYATVAAYGVATLISMLLSRNIFALPFPAMDLLRIVVATLCMAIVIWLLPIKDSGWTGLGALIVGGATAYLVTGWVLNIGNIRQRRFTTVLLRESNWKEKLGKRGKLPLSKSDPS